MNITDIIEPIKLKSGSHADTATTGSDCCMNVVAYLNGEPQITDNSPCVCSSVRPIAIWLNDMAHDEQREQLIPFIERAMGSVTTDHAELMRRINLIVAVANEYAHPVSEYAQWASKYAQSASKYAKWISDYAVAALKYAQSASRHSHSPSEYARFQALLFARGVRLLDEMLPKPSSVDDVVLARAERLVSTANKAQSVTA